MKLMLVTALMLTLGWAVQAQTDPRTDQSPSAKTDRKRHAKAAREHRAAVAPAEAQDATKAPIAAAQSLDADASTTSTAAPTATPAPTAAINSAVVAPLPPLAKTDLNTTIYRESEESLGAIARKMRARKAIEEAGKTQ
jgi:hypothetical protein